jgi:cell division protein YceG involved in septum cleavage
MRFNLLSSFAAGLFIATSICGIAYFSDKSEAPKSNVKTAVTNSNLKTQPSETEMKNKLTAAGYIVQTKAEYDKQQKDAKTSEQKGTATQGNSSKSVTRVFINVSNGMTSIDVGRILEEAKIIPNAFNFSQDIQNKGLENNLRPGTFEVDSGMSYDQVISTIFK